MPHRIQVFTGGCSRCKEAVEMVEVGKCKDCKMETLNVDDPRNRRLVQRYSINAVPSIVIDGKIKVVGVPDFPWFCGDEFYAKLEKEYPLASR
jgi:glutaredoxin